MKIPIDNYKEVPLSDHLLLKALLGDVEEINGHCQLEKKIYIDWQDFHNEYSPERIDPCPDYYGDYSIRFCDSDNIIGDFMTLNELDSYLCFLYSYVVKYD